MHREEPQLLGAELGIAERAASSVVAMLEGDDHGMQALRRIGHALERPRTAGLFPAEVVEHGARRPLRELRRVPVTLLERRGSGGPLGGRVIEYLIERRGDGRGDRDRQLIHSERVDLRGSLVGGRGGTSRAITRNAGRTTRDPKLEGKRRAVIVGAYQPARDRQGDDSPKPRTLG